MSRNDVNPDTNYVNDTVVQDLDTANQLIRAMLRVIENQNNHITHLQERRRMYDRQIETAKAKRKRAIKK